MKHQQLQQQKPAAAGERTSLLPIPSAQATNTNSTANSTTNKSKATTNHLLLSTTLSRFGSRSWEFVTPLLLLEWYPNSLLAPAALGLARCLGTTLLSPRLGSAADGGLGGGDASRMMTVAVGSAMQCLGCLLSVAALWVWTMTTTTTTTTATTTAATTTAFGGGDNDGGSDNGLNGGNDDTPNSDGNGGGSNIISILLLCVVIMAGVVESLGSQLASVSVKKEWIPIVFGNDDDVGDDDDDDGEKQQKQRQQGEEEEPFADGGGADSSSSSSGISSSTPATTTTTKKKTTTTTTSLSFVNTSMTNIDLMAATFAPVLAGWILEICSSSSVPPGATDDGGGGGVGVGGGGGVQRGFAVVALLNVISFVPELWLLNLVYASCPALRTRRRGVAADGGDGGDGGDSSDGGDGGDGGSDEEVFDPATKETIDPMGGEDDTSSSCKVVSGHAVFFAFAASLVIMTMGRDSGDYTNL